MAVQITVSVDDEHVARIDEVAGRLRAAGMEVEEVLRPLGLITGWVDTAVPEALARLDGVASVERQRTVRLPPPDTEIQMPPSGTGRDPRTDAERDATEFGGE